MHSHVKFLKRVARSAFPQELVSLLALTLSDAFKKEIVPMPSDMHLPLCVNNKFGMYFERSPMELKAMLCSSLGLLNKVRPCRLTFFLNLVFEMLSYDLLASSKLLIWTLRSFTCSFQAFCMYLIHLIGYSLIYSSYFIHLVTGCILRIRNCISMFYRMFELSGSYLLSLRVCLFILPLFYASNNCLVHLAIFVLGYYTCYYFAVVSSRPIVYYSAKYQRNVLAMRSLHKNFYPCFLASGGYIQTLIQRYRPTQFEVDDSVVLHTQHDGRIHVDIFYCQKDKEVMNMEICKAGVRCRPMANFEKLHNGSNYMLNDVNKDSLETKSNEDKITSMNFRGVRAIRKPSITTSFVLDALNRGSSGPVACDGMYKDEGRDKRIANKYLRACKSISYAHKLSDTKWNAEQRNALLVHGFNGSGNCTYILWLAHHLVEQKYRVFCFNARGIKTPLLNPVFFHIGWTTDVSETVNYILANFDGTLDVVGFSMGASWVTKYFGEKPLNSRITRGVAVCVPFDFFKLGSYFRSTFTNRLVIANYKKYLLRNEAIFRSHGLDINALRHATMLEMDMEVTKRIFGITNEQYRYNSCVNYIGGIKVPFMIINSMDDPLVPEIEVEVCKNNPNVVLVVTKYGGHLGFLGNDLKMTFVESAILEFFREF